MPTEIFYLYYMMPNRVLVKVIGPHGHVDHISYQDAMKASSSYSRYPVVISTNPNLHNTPSTRPKGKRGR